MGKRLIIAEKPSVAQAIGKVLNLSEKKKGYIEGTNYICTWCIGHLIGLAEPETYGYKEWQNLPVIPEKWNYAVKKETSEQFNIIKSLMNDKHVDSLICATDAGREGELIFRHVYSTAKCKKPFERLWISSLEDTAIKSGFENLKQGTDYDNLYKSALCRERADWLVGINATRALSVSYGSFFSVGRVQTPTVAMIAQRDKEISNFVKTKFYTVEINCGEFSASSDKITDLSEAEKVMHYCHLARAKVTDICTENKSISPPHLYDLTTLQRDANRIYGFTAKQTLESAQRLYDKKLSTYPRTDSQFLTEDMEWTAKGIIDIIIEKFDFANEFTFEPNISQIMNNSKVTDHHAIIPTVNIAEADMSALTDTDVKILYLISSRLLSATASKHTYSQTKVTLTCSDYIFRTSGRVIIDNGFKTIENKFNAYIRNAETSTNEETLPDIKKNQEFNVTAKVIEHYTTPPKHYTENTLLAAMEKAGNNDYDSEDVERKGLGTPATRAGIIETIIARGYIERKNKQLLITDAGITLIKNAPEKLTSAKLTAEWENRLTLIAKGTESDSAFMQDIIALVKEIINTKTEKIPREIIGICPFCGSNVIDNNTRYSCENPDCKFRLFKEDKYFASKGKKITKDVAKTLLQDGKINFNDLYSSKKKKKYSAEISIDTSEREYVKFNIDFK